MYAVINDLYTRFTQTEIDTLSNSDSTVVDQALSDATDTINGFIGGRYQLPLSVVPTILNRLCCDLARYNLYSEAVPEVVQTRHDNAIAMLKAISAGTATLGADDTSEPTADALPKIAGSARKFTDDTLDDYETPPAFPYS